MAKSAIFARAAEQWQSMRTDYDRFLRYEYDAAVEGTGGVLLNKAGRALRMDGLELFTGPRARAEKYASEELIEWWKVHPRISMSQYEGMWLDGQGSY